MFRCPYCGNKIEDNATSCPACRKSLAREDAQCQSPRLDGEIDKAKHEANMFTIYGILLITLGITGGGALWLMANWLGLFGGVLVCLGIGCVSAAERHAAKASALTREFGVRK